MGKSSAYRYSVNDEEGRTRVFIKVIRAKPLTVNPDTSQDPVKALLKITRQLART